MMGYDTSAQKTDADIKDKKQRIEDGEINVDRFFDEEENKDQRASMNKFVNEQKRILSNTEMVILYIYYACVC